MASEMADQMKPLADFYAKWSKDSLDMMSKGIAMYNRMSRAWTEVGEGAAAEKTDDMLKNVMKETGMSMVGGFPIVRDMASYLSSGFGGGGMYQTVGELPGRIWTQVQQGENDKAFRGAVSQGIGLVTGLPTTASMRVIEGVIDSDDRSWAEMFLGSNPLDR